jgi:hypothetical protein
MRKNSFLTKVGQSNHMFGCGCCNGDITSEAVSSEPLTHKAYLIFMLIFASVGSGIGFSDATSYVVMVASWAVLVIFLIVAGSVDADGRPLNRWWWLAAAWYAVFLFRWGHIAYPLLRWIIPSAMAALMIRITLDFVKGLSKRTIPTE